MLRVVALRFDPAFRFGLLGAALALGGCAGNGTSSSASNAFASVGTATVAFESVDGPPPQVFERLVSVLDSEAKLRGLPVVSRHANATYKVRSYLSAQVRGKRTTIAWTWDVYDRSEQRALRLSGEEAAARNGPDAWAAADDVVIRRIAQAGLTGLNGLMSAQPAPPPAAAPTPAPRDDGPAIAESPAGAPVPVAVSFRPN